MAAAGRDDDESSGETRHDRRTGGYDGKILTTRVTTSVRLMRGSVLSFFQPSHVLRFIFIIIYTLCVLGAYQVADFVGRFMPAYRAYLPTLYSEGPERRQQQQRINTNANSPSGREIDVEADVPVLKVVVNRERYPISSVLMN